MDGKSLKILKKEDIEEIAGVSVWICKSNYLLYQFENYFVTSNQGELWVTVETVPESDEAVMTVEQTIGDNRFEFKMSFALEKFGRFIDAYFERSVGYWKAEGQECLDRSNENDRKFIELFNEVLSGEINRAEVKQII